MPEQETPFAIVVCFEDERRERFLLAHHTERGWELPGGRLEPGERPIDAAEREFAEETGRELVESAIILSEETDEGPCWVAAGLLGSRVPGGTEEDDAIEEWRFVHRLDEVSPLAFPDDPYRAIEDALGQPLGAPQ